MKKFVLVFLLGAGFLSLSSFGLVEKHPVSVSKNAKASNFSIKSRSDVKKIEIKYNLLDKLDDIEENEKSSSLTKFFTFIYGTFSKVVKFVFCK